MTYSLSIDFHVLIEYMTMSAASIDIFIYNGCFRINGPLSIFTISREQFDQPSNSFF